MAGEETELTYRRPWDACREVPVVQDEDQPRKRARFLKWISCSIVGILVFALAVLSKGSFLLLITLSGKSNHTLPEQNKPWGPLSVAVVVIAPSILLLIKSLWKCIFKTFIPPTRMIVVWVLLVESLVALGVALLTIVSMPFFDIVTNALILNGTGILSSVLQTAAQLVARESKRFILASVMSIPFLVTGHVLFAVRHSWLVDPEVPMTIGLAFLGTLLVSLNWWQNYSTLFNSPFLARMAEDIDRSRIMVCVLSSLVRVLVTSAVVGAYVPLSGAQWSSVPSAPDNVRTIIWVLVAVQVVSSALCHWFSVVVCKMHVHHRSFMLPMYLASLAVVAAVLYLVVTDFKKTANITHSFTDYCREDVLGEARIPAADWFGRLVLDITHTLCPWPLDQVTDLALLVGSAVFWWLGLFLATFYIWFLKIQRIECTKDLFVRRIYEAAFIEQSMLLNTRFEIQKNSKRKRKVDPVKVYLCATMWHESYDEMMKILISMFRLDKYRPRNIEAKGDVSFEAHIYFDDAFEAAEGSKEHQVNEYGSTLLQVLREVFIAFSNEEHGLFSERFTLPCQKVIRTPYGGRLEITLPYGNLLMVHYKDKKKIRHKKRWSQIMYLYFLLGWKVNREYFQKFKNGEDELTLQMELKKEKQNTYLLALDGDTDFQPAAVMLLIDRLRRYPQVGAACGRIHPTGTGPMVWYQKFEYAVGHWLQKTAEHVLGCVLCSPGCFSLFRGAALMDDNVMKRYTLTATEASHYVQYDQGEDRWLCTLLLQQGWRVEYNAMSDAYTNAPQDFKEFYNQRRRWGPSTMANTLDLLGSGSLTTQRNSSISTPYVLYQIFSMAASILGPATVCMMTAGSFSFILKVDGTFALIISTLPPLFYLILCLAVGHEKSDLQTTVAAVMSVVYAFFMTGVVLSIIGDLVVQQTIWSPSGLFLIGMVFLYTITAILHPQEFHLLIYGLLYFICIPSAYLLLAIYSMVNMNNVSWGTRETGAAAPNPAAKVAAKHGCLVERCSSCPCWGSKAKRESQDFETIPLMEDPEEKADLNTQDKMRSKEFHFPPFVKQDTDWVSILKKKSGDLSLKEDYLQKEEEEFWKELQERYLKPLAEDQKKKMQIEKDLKELRNKATFLYFICNALWLVATFCLQLIGANIYIKIPKLHMNGSISGDKIDLDPIAIMFLLGFALLLVMQFLCMLYHRIYTLIHFVSYLDTESKPGSKRVSRESPHGNETPDNGETEDDTDYQCWQNPMTDSATSSV